MGRVRSYVTFANVVSVIALFAAVGLGTSWALSQNSIKSKHIKDGQVRSNDLADRAVIEAKLGDGAVTAAKLGVDSVAGGAVLDGSLGGADLDEASLGKVPEAASADSADDADALDGKDSADFAPAEAEDWHVLGTPGEPALDHPTGGLCSTGAWQNTASGFDTAAAFYRDPYGVVHLKGTVDGGVNHRWCHIFQLPPGYRPGPDFGETHPVITTGTAGDVIARLVIFGNTNDADEGGVTLFSGPASPTVILDGVSFRCHPSGVDGCP